MSKNVFRVLVSLSALVILSAFQSDGSEWKISKITPGLSDVEAGLLLGEQVEGDCHVVPRLNLRLYSVQGKITTVIGAELEKNGQKLISRGDRIEKVFALLGQPDSVTGTLNSWTCLKYNKIPLTVTCVVSDTDRSQCLVQSFVLKQSALPILGSVAP